MAGFKPLSTVWELVLRTGRAWEPLDSLADRLAALVAAGACYRNPR